MSKDKFRVGDRVEEKESACKCKGLGTVRKVYKGGDYEVEFDCNNTLKKGEWTLQLIKEAKMSIKDKIENINEDTTIKELDDLMEELHQARINGCGMGTINRYLLISTLNSYGEDIRIRDCNDTLLTSFHYDDQYSKLQAFKDALMWLAKKEGKLKDNKKEIEEVKEEIKAIRDDTSARVEFLLKKIERLEE